MEENKQHPNPVPDSTNDVSSTSPEISDKIQSQPAHGQDAIETQEALFTSGTSEMPA